MQTHDWLQAKRHAQDRRVLLWAHALIGIATWCLYLYRISLPPAAALLPNVGYFEFWMALPVLFPYLISALNSWRVYSEPYVIHNRLRLAGFIVVLAAGGVLIGWFIATPSPYAERIDFVLFPMLQAFAYMWAAQLLLNVV